MKKKVMLVGIIAAMGFGVFLTSCSKDEDEFKGCTCMGVYRDGGRYSFTVTAAEAKQYGATNCSLVAGFEMAAASGELASVNCSTL